MPSGTKVYNPCAHPRQAYLFALHGLTENIMAKVWEVHVQTLNDWKVTYPEFREALRDGGVLANAKVVEHFYLNCLDREVDIEEIHMCKDKVIRVKTKKFIQGDKWAQSRWMALKDPANWSEIQRIQIDQTNTNIFKLDLSCLTTEELSMYKKIHQHQIEAHIDLDNSGN